VPPRIGNRSCTEFQRYCTIIYLLSVLWHVPFIVLSQSILPRLYSSCSGPNGPFWCSSLPFQDENFLTCGILVQISSLLNHRVWMIPRRYRLGKHMHINGRDTTMTLWRLPVIPNQYVNFYIKVQMHVSFWSILVVIHWLHRHFWR